VGVKNSKFGTIPKTEPLKNPTIKSTSMETYCHKYSGYVAWTVSYIYIHIQAQSYAWSKSSKKFWPAEVRHSTEKLLARGGVNPLFRLGFGIRVNNVFGCRQCMLFLDVQLSKKPSMVCYDCYPLCNYLWDVITHLGSLSRH
jgi:hypothetical protein